MVVFGHALTAGKGDGGDGWDGCQRGYAPVNQHSRLEIGPFEDVFPIEKRGCFVATFVYWRVPSSKGAILSVENGWCTFKD